MTEPRGGFYTTRAGINKPVFRTAPRERCMLGTEEFGTEKALERMASPTKSLRNESEFWPGDRKFVAAVLLPD